MPARLGAGALRATLIACVLRVLCVQDEKSRMAGEASSSSDASSSGPSSSKFTASSNNSLVGGWQWLQGGWGGDAMGRGQSAGRPLLRLPRQGRSHGDERRSPGLHLWSTFPLHLPPSTPPASQILHGRLAGFPGHSLRAGSESSAFNAATSSDGDGTSGSGASLVRAGARPQASSVWNAGSTPAEGSQAGGSAAASLRGMPVGGPASSTGGSGLVPSPTQPGALFDGMPVAACLGRASDGSRAHGNASGQGSDGSGSGGLFAGSAWATGGPMHGGSGGAGSNGSGGLFAGSPWAAGRPAAAVSTLPSSGGTSACASDMPSPSRSVWHATGGSGSSGSGTQAGSVAGLNQAADNPFANSAWSQGMHPNAATAAATPAVASPGPVNPFQNSTWWGGGSAGSGGGGSAGGASQLGSLGGEQPSSGGISSLGSLGATSHPSSQDDPWASHRL